MCLQKNVLSYIKKGSNPFNHDEMLLSTNSTIKQLSELLSVYSREEILNVLNAESLRLEKIVNQKAGGMLAYESLLSDKEAHYNCKRAIEHLNIKYNKEKQQDK